VDIFTPPAPVSKPAPAKPAPVVKTTTTTTKKAAATTSFQLFFNHSSTTFGPSFYYSSAILLAILWLFFGYSFSRGHSEPTRRQASRPPLRQRSPSQPDKENAALEVTKKRARAPTAKPAPAATAKATATRRTLVNDHHDAMKFCLDQVFSRSRYHSSTILSTSLGLYLSPILRSFIRTILRQSLLLFSSKRPRSQIPAR
jgi:hypothetical protein